MIYEVRRTVHETVLIEAADQEEADAIGRALAEDRISPNYEDSWTWNDGTFDGATAVPEMMDQA